MTVKSKWNVIVTQQEGNLIDCIHFLEKLVNIKEMVSLKQKGEV